MVQKWSSNGKLMLTGEYFVLFGAKALAMPVKYGQSLQVEEINDEPGLMFVTHVLGKPWFVASFDTETFEIINTDECSKACYLQELFLAARLLNPTFLMQRKKVLAIANIDFNIDWGMGSSSSLISNIASWANVNPYELNRLVSRGSGYDIACARSNTALFFSLKGHIPIVKHVSFAPKYSSHLWFIYLEKKEATEANVSAVSDKLTPSPSQLNEISHISDDILKARTVSEMGRLMAKHEDIIAQALQKEPIQSVLFKDFKGVVKSLGAWGGDFCMAVSEENDAYVRQYFEQKGFRTVLSFDDLLI